MAITTSKVYLCIDTERDGDQVTFRGARIVNVNTLKEVGKSPWGEYRTKEAVISAVVDFFDRGGFRSGHDAYR